MMRIEANTIKARSDKAYRCVWEVQGRTWKLITEQVSYAKLQVNIEMGAESCLPVLIDGIFKPQQLFETHEWLKRWRQ
jgi:hypothetical protein